MIRSARTFALVLAFVVLLAQGASAGDVQILKAAVGNSTGPGGHTQLDIHLFGKSTLSSPGSLIGYFSDGKSGAPLTSLSGSSHSTKSGYLATCSGSIGGSGIEELFQTKMSIPHFELSKEPLKKRRIEVSLFLDQGSSYEGDIEFVDQLGFDVILDNPFAKSKKGKKGVPEFSEMIRPRFRTLLPDPPVVRRDNLGRWNLYTAFNPNFPMIMRRELATSIFVERGRRITLGGNVQWRHEGSGMDWQALYDAVGVQRGVVLPRVSIDLGVLNEKRRNQVLIESRFVQIDDSFFRDVGIPAINGADPQDPLVNQGLVVEPNTITLDHRMIQFDFTSNRVEAYTPVPTLSRIPVLNRLFTARQNLRNERTLLIFVTADLAPVEEQ